MSDPDEKFVVEVLQPDGRRIPGEIRIWEEAPRSAENVLVELSFEGGDHSEDGHDNFFDALVAIRERLEMQGLLLVCNGSSLNVYPSAMSKSMGYGEKAYVLELGKPALLKALVSIFKSRPDSVPATVKAQRAYFEEWLASLMS